MTRFEWDGLRKGDAVFVHHPITSQSSALSGAVEFVTVRAGRGNEIGIRLTDGASQVVWPSWMAVHRAPTAGNATCWRCDEVTRHRPF